MEINEHIEKVEPGDWVSLVGDSSGKEYQVYHVDLDGAVHFPKDFNNSALEQAARDKVIFVRKGDIPRH